MSPIEIRKICCIGAGYVGGPTSAVIAAQNPHIQVTVVDLSQPRIDAWNTDDLPIYEPGLLETVKSARDGPEANLHFSTEVDLGIEEADLIFIAVNTPTKTVGVGAGSAADIAYVESAARRIAEVSRSNKIVVEKSTVPCGTASHIREIFDELGAPGVRFDILSSPEFLAEGTAMNDLLFPDRVLIGAFRKDATSIAAAESFADVYAAWVPRSRIVTINLWSSELAKLAANCMLAQRISSVNALSAICEATGADIEDVSSVVGLDSRIGSRMLKASAGFGGSCFKKDVLSLVYIAESLHLPEIAGYWRAVVEINEYQKERFTKRIIQRLYNTLASKKIAVLGFAYKKNTGDTRESAAITIVQQLLAEKAKVAIYDPQVSEEQIFKDLSSEYSDHPVGMDRVKANVTVHSTAETACEDAAAVIILTEWDEFRTDQVSLASSEKSRATLEFPAEGSETDASSESGVDKDEPIRSGGSSDSGIDVVEPKSAAPARVDWRQIAKTMRRPRLIFDGRNIVEPHKLVGLGFRVECIGKSSM